MKIRAYKDNDKHEVISLWKERGLLASQNDPSKESSENLKLVLICFWWATARTEL